jgi:hypothetical protein
MTIHPDALFVLACHTALLCCGVFGVLCCWLCDARGVRERVRRIFRRA